MLRVQRRKGRVPLPENDLDGQPLTLRDSAQDSPLFVFETDEATSFDEVTILCNHATHCRQSSSGMSALACCALSTAVAEC